MSGTKRWAAGLFIALIFMYNHSGGLAQGETSAKAACVMEMETGRVLFEYNARARLPMASTTKVMTALLAIENGDLSSEVTCSSNAFGVPAIAVDTHVFRVANRIGLADAKDVLNTEKQLMQNIPEEDWSAAHHWIIFHGRRVCSARSPKCGI